MYTGLKAIDSMTAVGRGQRELIIGDRSTGKSGRDRHDPEPARRRPHLHLRGGRAEGSTVAQVVERLRDGRDGVHDRHLGARAGGGPDQVDGALRGLRDGEYFLYSGQHALCIYDDLSKHADAYRQLSLLLRRPPGREAFPATSSTSTRGSSSARASFSDELGGGSLTALPIIETQAGDIAACTSRRTSSRSPTGRSSSSRASSSRAFGPRSTSARRSRASAATHRRER
jgi:F-type H+-transporting ATPase subunit alpha